MSKEEIILKAIGMLPDEMIMQDVTEELMAGAVNIEKEEKKRKFLHKCGYALPAAACLAMIVTGLNILKWHSTRQPDTISDNKTNIMTSESNCKSINNAEDIENNDILKIFVFGDTDNTGQQKSYIEEDRSYNNDNKKEISYGKTVKLETVKEMQVNAASKGTEIAEYIVFSMDMDFYFTISKNTGNTYILDGKSGKKHFADGEEVLCKAGNKVYFDISGTKENKDSYGSVPAWEEDGKEVIAFADIYLKNNQEMETAGRFYIGRKERNKAEKDQEGDVYYGFFENKKED